LNDDNKRKISMIIDVIRMKSILYEIRNQCCGKKAVINEAGDVHDGVDDSDDEDFTPDNEKDGANEEGDQGKFFGPKE
jgi:hypothetical protein